MVELREIDQTNFEDVIKLSVSKHQETFVSTSIYSLAQAWLYQKTAYPFAIYADNVLVGFVMLGYYEARYKAGFVTFMEKDFGKMKYQS